MATGAGGRDGEQILRDVRKRMCQEQDALIDAGDQTITTLGRTIGATMNKTVQQTLDIERGDTYTLRIDRENNAVILDFDGGD